MIGQMNLDRGMASSVKKIFSVGLGSIQEIDSEDKTSNCPAIALDLG